jgi:hypothetical protein
MPHMAKSDIQSVAYMRKDSHFFADGTWYISTPCVVCGLVDEEVSWEEAKTPHHAGLIADQRHVACSLKADEATQRQYALAEIEVARGEVVRAEELLERARQALTDAAAVVAADRTALLDAVPDTKVLDQMLTDPKQRDERLRRHRAFLADVVAARDQLAKYERGIGEARQRLRNTEADNTPTQ